jgi:hypothetical protein
MRGIAEAWLGTAVELGTVLKKAAVGGIMV